MALMTTKRLVELGAACVLAPERYDPRREILGLGALSKSTVPLGTIARAVRHTVSPSGGSTGERAYLVFDTSDAREGIVTGRKQPMRLAEVGSAKKAFQPGDVLISRLRPYLRQVAIVDDRVGRGHEVELACSTEFFVLRSLDHRSIAFLVPYLLSASVQTVLAASQEGGHHPRFDEDALVSLPVPEALLRSRDEVSEVVKQSVALYRDSEDAIAELVTVAESAIAAETLPKRRSMKNA